jgi:hypothetical protein
VAELNAHVRVLSLIVAGNLVPQREFFLIVLDVKHPHYGFFRPSRRRSEQQETGNGDDE